MGPMPAFNALTDAQVNALARYVSTVTKSKPARRSRSHLVSTAAHRLNAISLDAFFGRAEKHLSDPLTHFR